MFIFDEALSGVNGEWRRIPKISQMKTTLKGSH
jgi:hypothetical protein